VRESVTVLIEPRTLTLHSLATAAAAEALARARHPEVAPEAFIASLLHNLGIPVQVQVDRAGWRQCWPHVRRRNTRALLTLEAEHARVGHAECMAVVYESWQLPESLVAATRYTTRHSARRLRTRCWPRSFIWGCSGPGLWLHLRPGARCSDTGARSATAARLEVAALEAVREALPGRVAALIEALLS